MVRKASKKKDVIKRERAVSKKPKSKVVKKVKKKAVRPNLFFDHSNQYKDEEYDEDDEAEEEEDPYLIEEKRVNGIYNEIVDFLSIRNDYVILEDSYRFMLVAKLCNLAIQKVHNKDGFTPLNFITQTKECLIRLIEFGGEPERDTLAYFLKKKGCPVITIHTKYEVESKLGE